MVSSQIRFMVSLGILFYASCAAQSGPALEVDGLAQAVSISGPYAQYSGMQGKRAQRMALSYRVTSDVRGPTATYFVATQVNVVDTNGADITWTEGDETFPVVSYIGMQPHSNLGTPAVVFSMFGPNITGTYADGTPCGGDADGGPGTSCLRSFTYSANTDYSLEIRHTGGGVYEGYSRGQLIATIRIPNGGGVGNHVVQFLEPYTGATTCDAAPYFKATLSVPSFTPAISLTTSTTYAEKGYCFNTYSALTSGGTGHTFEIGTPSGYSNVSLKAKSTGELARAEHTAQGCGGGRLLASGEVYDDCARFTEVPRGGDTVVLQTENGLRIRCSSGAVLADVRSLASTWTRVLGSDGLYAYRSGSNYLSVASGQLSCAATSLADAQRFLRTATEPAGIYNIRNNWLDTYLVDRGAGRVDYGAEDTGLRSTQWLIEPWSSEASRIKNRESGLYMNNEGVPVDASGNHVVALSAADPGWNSGAWIFEPVEGSNYRRIQSFWRRGEFIDVEQQLGYAELSAAEPGWWSAQWAFEPPAPAENKALLAVASGSTQQSSKRFAMARDGVVSSAKEWASAGEKSGAYLEYTWPSEQTLGWVSVSDRVNSNDRVLAGRLSFSDGSTVDVGALPNDGAAVVVRFPKRTVTSLRFTVTAVSTTTQNVGLAELEAH